MDVGSIGAIAGIIGVIVAIGSLLGTSMRVGRQTATVNNYREAAQSWEAKARSQGSEITDLKAKTLALEKASSAQIAEIQVLKDMVTGRQAIEELKGTIADLESKMITQADFDAWQQEVRSRLFRKEGDPK